MATKRCPKCGDEFIESVRRCPDCGVLLGEGGPAASIADGPDLDGADLDGADLDGDDLVGDDLGIEIVERGGQVVYALHELSAEERTLADQLLGGNDIPRVWEGTNLVLPKGARSTAEPLIGQALGLEDAVLDPDAPKLVYELGEWTDAEVSRLTEGLDRLGIPHEYTYEGDLVVLGEDEERIEALLDSIEFPDALAPDLDADAASGLDAQAALSDLFDAVDRLRKHARNADGVLGLVAAAKALAALDVPFGFAPAVWNDIVVQATTLRGAIEDDDESDDQIEERAAELRALVRNYV